MSQNSSKQPGSSSRSTLSRGARWWAAIALPLLVLTSFFIAQLLVIGVVSGLRFIGVPLDMLNESVLTSLLAAVLYTLSLAIVIVLPWVLKRHAVTWQELGLHRLVALKDVIATPIGLVVYFVLSAILVMAATLLLPWFDAGQVQDTGFGGISMPYEYIVAFVTLVVIAPIAEEVLFRGYLFGKLMKYIPVWIAILITSVLFGFVHGAWNIAIDTFALSIVMCLLRLVTGGLWAPILLHMSKNGIAFYLLFINPSLLNTLGG